MKSDSDSSSFTSVIPAFLDAMRAAGLDYTGDIVADGALHRVKVNGDRNSNTFYSLHLDGIPAGHFGCWKRGINENWCAVSSESMSADERAERDRKWQAQRAEREADRRRQNNEAATAAQSILDAAIDANDEHPYLVRKAVKVYPGVKVGAWQQRQKECCLLIPLRTADGLLATVQAIFPAKPTTGRDKDFLKGGAKSGAFFVIGDLHSADTVIIAEGYATTATLFEATGYAAVMAIDSGNLRPVAEILKKLYPKKRFIIAADNDRKEDGSNPGVKAATAAAKAANGVVAIPSFNSPLEDDVAGTDFNDLAAMHGLEAVMAAIESALAKVAKDTPAPAVDAAFQSHPMVKVHPDYVMNPGGTFWIKHLETDDVKVLLANFVAEIIAETVIDDGAERKLRMEISGRTADVSFPVATVANSQFGMMNWVGENWGNAAQIAPGMGLKDRLRYAIQVLSGNIQHRTVYEHTGWRQLNGSGWQYLFNGGAIGSEGFSDRYAVELPGTLTDYRLTVGGADAIRASLRMLEVAPLAIAAPLFAAPYAAILGEALIVDWSLFCAGTTGTRKTEVAAIVQNHFGPDWRGKHLPASWSSSGNSLERTAFLAKDTVLTIDDFCPHGTTADVARYHSSADRVLRAQGNRAGRGRMNADGSLRATYFPRGLIVSTGEDIPKGQSLRGRMLVLEFAPHTVNLPVLSQLQVSGATGELSAATGLFIQWLAPQMDELKRTLPQQRITLRNEIVLRDGHSRHPDTLAGLIVVLMVFERFATAQGIQLPADWIATLTEALMQTGNDQAAHQVSEEPAGRFITLIFAALSAGLCHVKRKDGREPYASEKEMSGLGWQLRMYGAGEHEHENWYPQGPSIGWFDDQGLYLEPDGAFRTVQQFATSQGNGFSLSKNALQKALDEKGRLVTKEKGRTTNQVRMSTGLHRVLHIARGVGGQNSGNNGNNGNNRTQPNDSQNENVVPAFQNGGNQREQAGTNWTLHDDFVPAFSDPVPAFQSEREQKNAANPLANNGISKPVPVVPVVPAFGDIPPPRVSPEKISVAADDISSHQPLTPPQFAVMAAIKAAGLYGETRDRIASACPRMGGGLVKLTLTELVADGLVVEKDGRYAVAGGGQ